MKRHPCNAIANAYGVTIGATQTIGLNIGEMKPRPYEAAGYAEGDTVATAQTIDVNTEEISSFHSCDTVVSRTPEIAWSPGLLPSYARLSLLVYLHAVCAGLCYVVRTLSIYPSNRETPNLMLTPSFDRGGVLLASCVRLRRSLSCFL